MADVSTANVTSTTPADNKADTRLDSKKEVTGCVPDEVLPGPEAGRGGRRGSRFKVEFADDQSSRADGWDSPSLASVHVGVKGEHDGGRRGSNGGHPPPYTPYYVDGLHDQLGQETLEALPHVDHYRDTVSAPSGGGGGGGGGGGAMRKRPTLVELHELDIVSNM